MRRTIVLCVVFFSCLAGCQTTTRYQECYSLPEHKPSVQEVNPVSAELKCPSLDLFALFPSQASDDLPQSEMAEEMDFTQDEASESHDVVPVTSPQKVAQTSENMQSETDVSHVDCIDINQADEAQLTRLPGVGPARARTIIASRQKKPFKRKKDLGRVKGIGPKSLQKISAYICDI